MSAAADTLPGNAKVTRQDWLDAAMDVLVSDGSDRVKILTLADKLEVSRSSFYWYFKDRDELLRALLEHWLATNTRAIVTAAKASSETITGAVCTVFKAFVDPRRFDVRLDFAVRDWARRSARVREVLEASDAQRIDALAAMFASHGLDPTESLIRGRVLYYMQIGYFDADLQETMEERAALIPYYLLTFTGVAGRADEIEDLQRFTLALGKETRT
ncbi:MAG: TetR/AcrR family transcriptional regulator [Silicimonas sp.]|nr:TetR/AcrR family transcriptional regulator [Silicimonas sp.]